MAPPKRDDFVEGLRGSGWNKYSPGYQTGEMWRKALTYTPPPSSAKPSPTFIPPAHRSARPLPRAGSSSDFRPSASFSGSSSSRSGGKGLKLFTAIIGALIFAAMANNTATGAPVMVAAIVGAIVGKLIALLARLAVGLIKIALCAALLLGIVYVLISIAK